MLEFWKVVGKACLNNEFEEQLSCNCKDDLADLENMENLYNFLVKTHGYLLSRWELGEINHIFGYGKIKDLLGKIRIDAPLDLWPIKTEKFWAVIGLACLDGGFCRLLATHTESDDANQMKMVLIPFQLTDMEVETLIGFLKKPGIIKALQEIGHEGWTKPYEDDPDDEETRQKIENCDWAFTFSNNYRHLRRTKKPVKSN